MSLLRDFRAARLGVLPKFEQHDVVDSSVPGGFPVGRAVGQSGRLYWCPTKKVPDPPHAMIVGASGGGKTTKLEEWALCPGLWNAEHGTDWAQTLILDPNGGSGFFAARSQGAEVISHIGDIRDALRSAYNHAERRNRLFGEIPIQVPDSQGHLRLSRATNIGQLNAEQREEWDIHPQLFVIDELADLLGTTVEGKEVKKVWAEARAHFTNLAQKARSAGIVVVVGIQRPDASILSGFARDQIQARLALGNLGAEGWRMVLGATKAKEAEEEADFMTPGQGWAANMGGKKYSRIYSPLIDRAAYLPYAVDPAAEPHQEGVPRRGTGPVGGAGGGAFSWVRSVATGWLVRGLLRVWGLRLLVGGTVEVPLRDPWVPDAVRREGKRRCVACGRGGLLQVDHKRPLWAKGKDTVGNCWLLCIRPGYPSCHGAKTATETWVRRIRSAAGTLHEDVRPHEGLRERLSEMYRAVPRYVTVLSCLFLAGMAYPRLAWPVVVVVGLGELARVLWKIRKGKWGLAPREDHAKNPQSRREWFFDRKYVKENPRTLNAAYTASSQGLEAWGTATHRRILFGAAAYLGGAVTLPALARAPAAVWALLTAIF